MECKWSKNPVGSDILQDLESKAAVLRRESGKESVIYGLCARSGFTEQLREQIKERPDVLLFDWEEMIGTGVSGMDD